jgi:hypothetical protein
MRAIGGTAEFERAQESLALGESVALPLYHYYRLRLVEWFRGKQVRTAGRS